MFIRQSVVVRNLRVMVAAMLAAAMVVAPSAFAEKVVVFSPQAAIMNSDAAKKAAKAFESNKEIASLVAKAESLRADLQAMAKEAEKNITWDAAKQAEHRKKMEYVNADYQLAAKKFQSEQKGMSEKLLKDMQPKLEKAVSEIQKSENIDIVLRREVVIFAKPETDITQKVIKKLNQLK